jgi:hypothetical protein
MDRMAERIRRTKSAPRAIATSAQFVFSLAICCLLALLSSPAQALIVATLGNNTAPIGTNDPGWSSVTEPLPEPPPGPPTGYAATTNYVYLGNSWILAARHVGVFNAVFSTGTFSPIPNQNFVVTNPVASGLTASNGTLETDLRLIRINGDPGLPSMFGPNPAFTLPTQEPSISDSVTFIGQGPTRASTSTSWDASGNEVPPSQSPIAYSGYKASYADFNNPNYLVYPKHWGMNNIADPSLLQSQVIGPAGVVSLKTGDGVTRKIVSLATQFDQSGGPYEAQAVTGDSGSGVFRKNPTTQKWELAGIVNSIYTYDKQPTLTAAYGDLTTFADLAYYHDQILNVINSNPGYSVLGDINLDGVVSGDGTGPAATDDVTAFIQGWGYNQAAGNITSWKKGDLNQDGKVDVNDFLLLRQAFNSSTGSAASLAALAAKLGVGNAGVPEPSSLILAAIGGCCLAMRYWRRARTRT